MTTTTTIITVPEWVAELKPRSVAHEANHLARGISGVVADLDRNHPDTVLESGAGRGLHLAKSCQQLAEFAQVTADRAGDAINDGDRPEPLALALALAKYTAATMADDPEAHRDAVTARATTIAGLIAEAARA